MSERKQSKVFLGYKKEINFLVCIRYQLHERVCYEFYEYDHETIIWNQLGLEENLSPQFETIIKDRFLKALPAKVAACSGNWIYTDLIGLAKCATEYMKANKRYTEGSTSSDKKTPRLAVFLIGLIILNHFASHFVISTKTQKQVI